MQGDRCLRQVFANKKHFDVSIIMKGRRKDSKFNIMETDFEIVCNIIVKYLPGSPACALAVTMGTPILTIHEYLKSAWFILIVRVVETFGNRMRL